MDHDDDVEHLFSWLQTPELRYREFAGAREITDVVVSSQGRANTASAEAVAVQPAPAPAAPPPLEPIARAEPVVERGPATIAPVPMAPDAAASAAGDSPFALGAAGRSALRRPEAPVAAEPSAAPRAMPAAPMRTAAPAAPAPTPAPPPPPQPAAPPSSPQPAGGGLLGGADSPGNGTTPPPEAEPRSQRSLDAVFSRLAGGRSQLPDPRERLRHIPGLGPPPNRPR
ncbi:MAG TPA: hypothetical protein VMB84_15510 [Stellaceae bacterium]|nr:hypothetical protein [Stellaceae bacterium]